MELVIETYLAYDVCTSAVDGYGLYVTLES